jgi:hypothetical protein
MCAECQEAVQVRHSSRPCTVCCCLTWCTSCVLLLHRATARAQCNALELHHMHLRTQLHIQCANTMPHLVHFLCFAAAASHREVPVEAAKV